MNVRQWSQNAILLLSVSCFSIGILVIIGWYTKSLAMLTISPHFAPMQFNTALCICLASVALSLISLNKKLYANFFIASLLLLSTLTFFEIVFNINLDIDELFVSSFVSTNELYPGRMAPNTALGFVIISFLLAVINNRKLTTIINMLLIFFTFFTLSMGVIAILGYLTGVTTSFGIGQLTKMALHTAFCFILLNIGILLQLKKQSNILPCLLSAIVTFTIANITFLGWQAIKQNQEKNLHSIIYTKLSNIKNLLQTDLEERISAFQRISYRWLSTPDGTPKELWESDAMHYIHDQDGYVAIEWVDSNYIIRWVVPTKGNEHVIGFNLYKEKNRRAEIQAAITQNKLQISNQLDLIQGGKGVLLFSPLIKNNKVLGLMVGVINTQLFIGNLLNKIDLEGFSVQIKDNTSTLYDNRKSDSPTNKAWQQITMISGLYGHNWNIALSPNNIILKKNLSTLLPSFFIFIGIMVSFLSGLLTRSLISIKELKNQTLNANERLQGIIEGSTDYIAAIDLDWNLIALNNKYRSEIYRLIKLDLKVGMNFKYIAERLSQENRDKVIGLWQKALDGISFTIEESFKDHYFMNLNFEIRYNPIFDRNGKLIGASHIATNITERRNKEDELLIYKEKLEDLVSELGDKNKQLFSLKEFSSLIQTNKTLSDSKKIIKIYAAKLFNNLAGALYLLNQNNDELSITIEWGDIQANKPSFSINDCYALLKNSLYTIDNTQQQLMCHHVESSPKKPSGYACIPLFTQRKMLGILYIELHNEHDTEKTLTLAQMFAEQISLNISNIQLQEHLQSQSTHDELTSLFNRRFFDHFIGKKLASADNQSFNILLIDIDFFKKINDYHGHLVGDKVLVKLGQLLKKHFASPNLAARWGGEEFIIYCESLSTEQLINAAEQFREEVGQLHIKAPTESISFTVSIGITKSDSLLDDKESLFKRADDALYAAKKAGRNRVIYHEN